LTADIQNWLPKAAFTEASVAGALATPLSAWSERWLANDTLSVSAVSTEGENLSAAESYLEACGSGLRLEVTAKEKRYLLEAALGTGLAGLELREGDHRLLDTLVATMIEDLCENIDQAFSIEQKFDNKKLIVEAMFSIGGQRVARGALAASALVPLIRASLGPARKAETEPLPFRKGLAATTVMLESVLGHAEVAVEDFRDLAVGDVLILDRGLHEPIELRTVENRQTIGFGKFSRKDGRMAIQF
jgi:flagellar motor switch/type III secretory pathway protein FliN